MGNIRELSTKNKIKILATILLFIVACAVVYTDFRPEPVQEQTPKSILMDFGPYGTHAPYFDPEKEQWTLGLWEESAIYPSEKNITDLQKVGGVMVFQMPYDGEINNNAGQLFVNGVEWENGNPVRNSKDQSMIRAGQKVEIRYGAENQSAGFQIWFRK